MEALANGMASSFSRFRETVVGPMLERMKERKTSVTDAIGTALDAVFKTASVCLKLFLLLLTLVTRITDYTARHYT